MGRIDFSAINAAALQCFDSLLREWLPDGHKDGPEYKSLNPTRADSRAGSFSINVVKGVWQDFATDDKGSDPVFLVRLSFPRQRPGRGSQGTGGPPRRSLTRRHSARTERQHSACAIGTGKTASVRHGKR